MDTCSAVLHTGNESHILSSITKLKYRLVNYIEPDSGLLDELLSLEALSRRQCAKVRHGDKTVYERNSILLDLLTSEDQCDMFLKALQRTGQQHVVKLITQNRGH